jgi:hypothetical protein
MAIYDYRIAAGTNVALVSLTNVEDLLTFAPRSQPVDIYPVRRTVLSGAVVWQAKAMVAESQANREAFKDAMELAKQAFETEVAKCHEERTKLTDKLINIALRPHNQREGDKSP